MAAEVVVRWLSFSVSRTIGSVGSEAYLSGTAAERNVSFFVPLGSLLRLGLDRARAPKFQKFPGLWCEPLNQRKLGGPLHACFRGTSATKLSRSNVFESSFAETSRLTDFIALDRVRSLLLSPAPVSPLELTGFSGASSA